MISQIRPQALGRRGHSTSFLEKYERASRVNKSLLCVGLDPNRDQMPEDISKSEFLIEIIAATSDLVCAYKPNSPFFEEDGAPGFEELKAVIERIPDDIPVVLDSKRADIEATSEFFARATFEHFDADAVVVNPYMGRDSLEPFFEYEKRHSFVLCRTSNASREDFQNLVVGSDGRPLYEHVAQLATEWNTRNNVGLVVGATDPEGAKRVRDICGDMLLLAPGLGFQGGNVSSAVQSTVNTGGGGVLLNASRDVLYAGKDQPDYRENFGRYAREAAERLRAEINNARSRASSALKVASR
jgi:orotidine 5'-phosphate decarboxylase subfamily 2